MKILLLSKYSRSGASSRLRTLQYIPSLESCGMRIVVKSLFDEAYLDLLYSSGKRSAGALIKCYLNRALLLLRRKDYDLIWVEKEVFPYLPIFIERFFLRLPYVVDYDDAVFHNYDLSRFFLIRLFLKKKIDAVMQGARCVVVGNAYLGARASKAGASKISLIPTVVDSSRYLTGGCAQQPLTIGWIGSPSTQKYVIDICDALADACRMFDAQVLLVGATHDIVAQLPGVNVKVLPWSETTEAELISKMSIGIMPLPDGPWERGKCGYKLIQYMACSVPVVASAVGVNVDIVQVNGCGYLAQSISDWKKSLGLLLESAELRAAFGASGRKAVIETFSLQAQAPVLRKVFELALGNSPD